MRIRTIASLGLLPSAAASRPLAFATGGNGRSPPAFSSRVRRRAVARTLLHAASAEGRDPSEFARLRPRTRLPSTTASVEVPEAGVSSVPSSLPSSTALSMIVDSQKEFELNLGRVVDALKSDYPKLLTEDPRWEVYHPDLEVIDPTGVSLHGLENYKMAFGFIHNVVKWFYSLEKSGLTSIRVGYDWARKCIRVSWNVEVVPRLIYGGTKNTLHVDGISEYNLDRDTGLITEHRVSHLLINDQPVRPENGIFNALAEISPEDPEGVPVFFAVDANSGASSLKDIMQVKFQTWNPFFRRQSSLFANPNEHAMELPDPTKQISTEGAIPYDHDALQRKNASRKKFGMPPLTPEEFIRIEEEVRAMDMANKKRAAYLAEQYAEKVARSRKEKEGGLLGSLFGGALKNGCESNFDCERPKVCCDVGFKKICCANGLGIVEGVPVERYPRGLLRMPLPNDNADY